MKRLLAVAALVIALPFATAAECYYKDKGTHNNPSPSPSDHCLMDKNGCVPPPSKK